MSEGRKSQRITEKIRNSKWVALPILVFIIIGCLILLTVVVGVVREFSFRQSGMVVRPLRSQVIAFSCFTLSGFTWFYAAYAILKGRPGQGYSVALGSLVVTGLFYFMT